MFTALTLSLVMGAPVPAPTAPVAAGVAPKVVELKANPDGKIMVAVTRMEKVTIGAGAAIAPANPGGGAVPPPAQIVREIPVTKMVEIGDVKDLTVTTADGKKLTTEEALKKIGSGAIVVVAGDGKTVSPAFLKVFKDDTLVLASPELTGPQGGVGVGGGVIRPGIRPLPPVQIQPGVIKIQPGVIQVLPAQPGAVQIEVVPAVDLPLPVPVEKAPEKK